MAEEVAVTDAPPSARAAVAQSVTVLKEAFWTRPFLLLAGTFFVCGWTMNGIIFGWVFAAHMVGAGAAAAAAASGAMRSASGNNTSAWLLAGALAVTAAAASLVLPKSRPAAVMAA